MIAKSSGPLTERIVEVEWEDSDMLHGWHTEAETPLVAGPCRSVGYLFSDTDKAVVLTLSLDDAEPAPGVTKSRLGCTITIPRSAISKVTELTRKR